MIRRRGRLERPLIGLAQAALSLGLHREDIQSRARILPPARLASSSSPIVQCGPVRRENGARE
jgi:hypothetical protein